MNFPSLSVCVVDAYRLPFSAYEVVPAYQPGFGHSIIVEINGDHGFDTTLLAYRPYFCLTFGDSDIDGIHHIYRDALDHICAWRDDHGHWVAFTDLYLVELGLDIAL